MNDEQAEPVWLSWRIVESIHLDQILEHGGSRGVRNRELIESALARPRNKWQYEGADVFALAAPCGFGIAKNHGLEDGNKRTAFMSLYTFLGLNGYDLDAPEPDVVTVMTAIAEGKLPEEGLADWIRACAREFP